MKCSECKEEFDEVGVRIKKWGTAPIRSDGSLGAVEFDPALEELDYLCPECDQVLDLPCSM